MNGTMFDGIAKLADVVFNKRPAEPQPNRGKVTIEELIRRGTSHVLVNGQLYRVEVTKAEVAGK